MELYSAGVALKLLEGVSCSARKKKKRNWLKAESKSRVPATKKTNQWNWTLAVQRPPIGRFIFNEIGLSIDSQCPLSVHFSEPIISQSNSLSLSSYPAGIKATETKECPSDAKKNFRKNSYFSLYSPHRHIHYIFFVCNSLENFFNFFF